MLQRILIIDDDPSICQFVATMLDPKVFEVEAAHSGPEGLRKAEASPPNIILLDVMMPGMDGYGACQLLRQGAKTGSIPVVMLTASNEPALNRKAYAAGASACVLKPFRVDSLVATVHAVLASTGKPRSTKKPGPTSPRGAQG